MTFVVAITKDRQGHYENGDLKPSACRFQVRPGYAQPPVATSRGCATPAQAKREAERTFGPAQWRDPKECGVTESYVVSVALYEVNPN
jgi:hypothetical protein